MFSPATKESCNQGQVKRTKWVMLVRRQGGTEFQYSDQASEMGHMSM